MFGNEGIEQAIVLNINDNVATALQELPAEAEIRIAALKQNVKLKQAIAFGHKFALSDIAYGELVRKYGVPIGRTTSAILAGEHVHLHNMISLQKEGMSDERIQAGGWKNRNS